MKGSMNRDGLLALCEYDAYANNLVLETVTTLTEEEFTRESSPSHHCVRKLILHTIETENFFLCLCQGRPRQELPDLTDATDIRHYWDNLGRELQNLITSLSDNDLTREIPFPYRIKGQSLCFPEWQLLLQAFIHCAQHRSELSVVLTELGHPLPNLDIILHFIERNKQFQPET